MIEKETAKFEKPPIVRKSCCAYPRRSRSRASSSIKGVRSSLRGIGELSGILRQRSEDLTPYDRAERHAARRRRRAIAEVREAAGDLVVGPLRDLDFEIAVDRGRLDLVVAE